MANPAIVTCTAGQYTKVATNVTAGQIHRISKKPNIYLHTYRETGDPAPTDRTEGIKMFLDKRISEIIQSSVAIDVYVWCEKKDGIVRVDL